MFVKRLKAILIDRALYNYCIIIIIIIIIITFTFYEVCGAVAALIFFEMPLVVDTEWNRSK